MSDVGEPLRPVDAVNQQLHPGQPESDDAWLHFENLCQLVLAALPDAVLITGPRGNIRYVSPNVARVLGYSAEEIRSFGTVEKLLGPTLLSGSEAEWEASGEIQNLERNVSRRDGAQRVLLINVKKVSIDSGTIVYSFRDITKRKRLEMRVGQLNRIYAVLSGINETIVRESDSQRLFEASCRIAVDKGYFKMAWIGMVDTRAGTIDPVAYSAASSTTVAVLKALFSDPGGGCAFTTDAIRTGKHSVCNSISRDPRSLPWREYALERGYRAMASLPLVVNDEVIGTFNLYAGEEEFFDDEEMQLLDALAADISFAFNVSRHEAERRRALVALRDSEERFRQLTETIQDVFWMTDPQREEVLYVSSAYEKIWGRSCESLYADPLSWIEAIHADDRERVINFFTPEKLKAGYDAEYRIVRPDGAVRWVRDRAFAIPDPTGRIERLVGVARDITERRELEEQFRQSQKMEGIGLLAGGVAHDFNNILAAIIMNSELMALTEDLPDELRSGLQEIRGAAERAANLTRQLLLFSRRQVMQLQAVDLNDVVTNLARMLQRIIGEHIRLDLSLSSAPLITRADPGMLDQIILNLAVNARDAMPKGGRLSIETGNRTVDEAYARTNADATPGRYLWLRMSDAGSGIEPSILPRIFEPFFTTKEVGKGTGLGLATVYGIVKQHKGWIEVHSKLGRGTTFTIYLPVADEGKGEARPKTTITRGGTETILLVEDEAAIRSIIRAVLERYGYRVREAASGVEALKLWEQLEAWPDLLLTDLIMPDGMTGQQLANELVQRAPHLKIVFMSGYTADLSGHAIDLAPGDIFLQKPFARDALLATIRQCLDSPERGAV